MEDKEKERPREEGHRYTHTVIDLPYKHDKVTCPGSNFHRVGNKYYISEYSPGVTPLVPHTIYKCTCGCMFEWEDRFNWKIIGSKQLTKAEFGLTWD